MRRWILALLLGLLAMCAQPVTLRYSRAGSTLQGRFHYDAGLEGIYAAGEERFGVRMMGYDPMWESVYDTAASLATQQELTVGHIVGRIDGTWDAMNAPTTAAGSFVNAIVVGPDHDIYIGGNFTDWNGDGNQDFVAKWSTSGSSWSALDTGLSGNVNDLVFDAAGNLWVGGTFLTDGSGSTTLNRVGMWDGSSWSSAASGLDEEVLAIAIDDSGNVWAGGDFTSDIGSGSKTLNRIGYWDGSTWNAAASGLDDSVHSLFTDSDGNVWAGGDFTSDVGSGSKTLNRIGYWDGSTWNAAGSGFNSTVLTLDENAAGDLYAGGGFSADGTGTLSFLKVAKWNGVQWTALGAGLDNTVDSIDVLPDGRLLVGGIFSEAGGQTLPDGVAVWNGTIWHQLDIDLPETPVASSVAHRKRTGSKYDIFLSSDTSGTATVSSQPGATAINNAGNAPAYPIIKVKRTGGSSATLSVIRNETQQKELLFDLGLLDGEQVTIDLRPGKKKIYSSYRSNLLGDLLPNSDLATWKLIPGNNNIYTYVETSGSPTVTATMQWKTTHLSVDEAVDN